MLGYIETFWEQFNWSGLLDILGQVLAVLLCLLCYEKASGFLNWLFFDTVSALLSQQLG